MIYCRLGRKCFFDFIEGKKQLVLFDWSNNSGVIDVKMDSLFLKKHHLLRCRDYLSLLNWSGALLLSLLLKLPLRKYEP